MDYLDFVVHILSPQTRQSYKLEKLWGDGVTVKPQALTA
jgi:ribosomal silencing factor RsfS